MLKLVSLPPILCKCTNQLAPVLNSGQLPAYAIILQHNYWLEVDTLLLQRTFCCTSCSSEPRSSLPELLRHTITIALYSMYHCSLLDVQGLGAEFSTTYGINCRSPLNDISNFHVVNQLPQDIMHILLEGVVPYQMSLMLSRFITDNK